MTRATAGSSFHPDTLKNGTSIFNRVFRAQQADLALFGWRLRRRADVHVPHGEFAQHLRQQITEINAAAHILQIWLIVFFCIR